MSSLNWPEIQFVGSKIFDFLNSQLVSGIIGSGFGAFGGAFIIWKIDQKKELKKTLAEVNSGMILIANATTTLINFKKQIVLPKYKEIIELKEIYNNWELSNGKIELRYDEILKHIIKPKLDLNLNFKFLCDHATVNPDALMLCQKAADTIVGLKYIIHKLNKIVDEINLDHLDPVQKALKYLGVPLKGQINDSLHDFIKGLKDQVDDGLYFANKASIKFREVGLKVIPKKWHSKIVKIEFINPEDKKLIPPDDFKEGY